MHARWVAHEPLGERADLRQWRLSGADLAGRDLTEAVMRDADLSNATLVNTKLVRADLRFSLLCGADLRGADLSGALLDFSSLAGATLTVANFQGASLKNTNLDDVRMSWFDHTLVAERLFRAAGGNLERQMVAAFVGHTVGRCWKDYSDLPLRHRLWVLRQLRSWVRDGDEAPAQLTATRPGRRRKFAAAADSTEISPAR